MRLGSMRSTLRHWACAVRVYGAAYTLTIVIMVLWPCIKDCSLCRDPSTSCNLYGFNAAPFHVASHPDDTTPCSSSSSSPTDCTTCRAKRCTACCATSNATSHPTRCSCCATCSPTRRPHTARYSTSHSACHATGHSTRRAASCATRPSTSSVNSSAHRAISRGWGAPPAAEADKENPCPRIRRDEGVAS